MDRPVGISKDEWRECQEFAFQYAKQQGFYDDIAHFKDRAKSKTWGDTEFENGLQIAVVSCKFWRDFYKRSVRALNGI